METGALMGDWPYSPAVLARLDRAIQAEWEDFFRRPDRFEAAWIARSSRAKTNE